MLRDRHSVTVTFRIRLMGSDSVTPTEVMPRARCPQSLMRMTDDPDDNGIASTRFAWRYASALAMVTQSLEYSDLHGSTGDRGVRWRCRRARMVGRVRDCDGRHGGPGDAMAFAGDAGAIEWSVLFGSATGRTAAPTEQPEIEVEDATLAVTEGATIALRARPDIGILSEQCNHHRDRVMNGRYQMRQAM